MRARNDLRTFGVALGDCEDLSTCARRVTDDPSYSDSLPGRTARVKHVHDDRDSIDLDGQRGRLAGRLGQIAQIGPCDYGEVGATF